MIMTRIPFLAPAAVVLLTGGCLGFSTLFAETVNGRRVERIVKTYGAEFGYRTPVQEVYLVQHPVPEKDVKGRPLYVVLHSSGHDAERALACTRTLDNHDIYRAPDDFYALYLDCRMASATDWWWGTNACPGFTLSPCERRVLATVEEVAAKYAVDRDRIYLCGNSMGGSGTLGIGLRHGDVFAAIKANVPALVNHVSGRMGWDMEKDADAADADLAAIPDPPLLIDYSAPNDNWSAGHGHLVAMMRDRKYPWQLLWGAFGHADNDSEMLPKNDIIHAFAWTNVCRSAVLPVFTDASSDDPSPWPDHRDTMAPGQINAFFRWSAGTASATNVSVRLFLADVASRHFHVPETAVADVTLRRLGAFTATRGDVFSWTYGDRTGTAVVGADGLVSIPRLAMTRTPQTLTVTRSAESGGAVACAGRYKGHLQGVATDGRSLYWSFTVALVKTDLTGKILAARTVPNHHGDLCCVNGLLYVAVNRGRFNQENAAVSEVRAYDADTLAPGGIWTLPDMPHGAGGITWKDGRFHVVGGLPATHEANHVYEYTDGFRLLKRHDLATGFTLMGIQTAEYDASSRRFLFGIYGGKGNPPGVIVTDADLSIVSRHVGPGGLGLVRIGGRLYVGGMRNWADGCEGWIVPAPRLTDAATRYVPAKNSGNGHVRFFFEGRHGADWDDAGYVFGPDGYRPLSEHKAAFVPAQETPETWPAVGLGGNRPMSVPDLIRGVRRAAECGETLSFHLPGDRTELPKDAALSAAVDAICREAAALKVPVSGL